MRLQKKATKINLSVVKSVNFKAKTLKEIHNMEIFVCVIK